MLFLCLAIRSYDLLYYNNQSLEDKRDRSNYNYSKLKKEEEEEEEETENSTTNKPKRILV